MAKGTLRMSPSAGVRSAPPGSQLDRSLFKLTALFVVVIFAVLAWPGLTRRVFSYDDLTGMNIPMRFSYWSALHSGDNILWSPYFHCGVYLHGESEVGMFHPLHLVLYRLLPLDVAFNLEFLFTYAALFSGSFVLLRHFALQRSVALIGAMLFSFSGFNLFHFMHSAPLAVVAHIPWLLVANDIVLCSPDRKKVARAQLAVSLLTASQCLLGHPQFGVYSLLAELAFALICMRRWADRRRPIFLVISKAIGGLIGAVQLIPLWDYVQKSPRGESGMEFRLTYSLHPLNFFQLWSPFAFKERYYSTKRIWDGNSTLR